MKMKKFYILVGLVLVAILISGCIQKIEQPTINEVEVKPGSPYTLADGETKIILEEGGSLNEIMGRPKVTIGDEKIDVAPTTIIANKGYTFNVSVPYDCKTHSEMHGDVGVTIIDSCMFKIITEKKTAPAIDLEKLSGTFDFDVESHAWYSSRTSPIKRIEGADKHFIGVRVTDADLYNLAGSGSEDLFTDLTMDVITNFGIKNIFVKYGEEKELVIGPEKIKVEILSVEETNKVMTYGGMMYSAKLNINAEPTTNQKEAIILDYK